MSRGIGKTQRRILEELAATEEEALSVVELADRIGVSDRQIRRAVHALADRELVVLTKGWNWAGGGKYGPLVPREHTAYGPDVPTALLVKAGDDPVNAKGQPYRDLHADADIEYVRGGLPSGVSLLARLPEQRGHDTAIERDDPEVERQVIQHAAEMAGYREAVRWQLLSDIAPAAKLGEISRGQN